MIFVICNICCFVILNFKALLMASVTLSTLPYLINVTILMACAAEFPGHNCKDLSQLL